MSRDPRFSTFEHPQLINDESNASINGSVAVVCFVPQGALTPHFGSYVPRQSEKRGSPELILDALESGTDFE